MSEWHPSSLQDIYDSEEAFKRAYNSLKVKGRRAGASSTKTDRVEEGRKDDSGKATYELLPPELLEGVSIVLEFGSRKYAPRNWEKGMRWGRVFGACMRHMWAWWRGEAVDPETGYSHLWHAATCVSFLMAYEQRGIGEDDRTVLKPRDAKAAVGVSVQPIEVRR